MRLSYSRPFYHATLFIVSVSTTEDIYRWDVYIMRVCLFVCLLGSTIHCRTNDFLSGEIEKWML